MYAFRPVVVRMRHQSINNSKWRAGVTGNCTVFATITFMRGFKHARVLNANAGGN